MQYMRIFSKKEDEYVRYWASISTEKVDKDGKGTGKYARANMSVRLSSGAVDVFTDNSKKTKTKGIRQLDAEVTDFWLKAVETKEGDSFISVFINKMRPAENTDDEEDD